MSPASEVFLSYSHHDEPWIKQVAAMAEAVGVKPYLFNHDHQPGTNVAEKVQAAIRRSSAVVVLITQNSVVAPYVQQEIGYALSNRKRIIPLVEQGVTGESLAMLQAVEYIPFDFALPEQALTEIAEALHRLQQQRRDDELLVAFLLVLLALGLLAASASK